MTNFTSIGFEKTFFCRKREACLPIRNVDLLSRSKAKLWIGIIPLISRLLLLFLVSANCLMASNAIVDENALPGNLASEWDIDGAGDSSIQGFATDISFNQGETANFKIKTSATNYRLDIYRLGFYGGRGARKIDSVTVSRATPQNQPNPMTDSSTGLIDCGNWAISASWAIPPTAVSGVYIARLVRTDTLGASHIVFVVRDDDSTSDLIFQTSDTTWQAYNDYGGNSFYSGSPAGRAYKLSYNRPLTCRGLSPFHGVFAAEYPMIRWLEANGYDVTYTTGLDTHRRGDLLSNSPRPHKVFLSVGHDEYWSGGQRVKVEAARRRGCASRVLCRQRHLLEDALGAVDRWIVDAEPHARLLQGNLGQRKDRSQSRLDGDVA